MRRAALITTLGLAMGLPMALRQCKGTPENKPESVQQSPNLNAEQKDRREKVLETLLKGVRPPSSKPDNQALQEEMETQFWDVAAELEEDLQAIYGEACVLNTDPRNQDYARLDCYEGGYKYSTVLGEVKASTLTEPSPYHVVVYRLGHYDQEERGRPLEAHREILANDQEELSNMTVAAIDDLYSETLE